MQSFCNKKSKNRRRKGKKLQDRSRKTRKQGFRLKKSKSSWRKEKKLQDRSRKKRS
jgi:hypothetical protein